MDKESCNMRVLGNISLPEYLQPNNIEILKHIISIAKSFSNNEDIVKYANDFLQALEKIVGELELLKEPVENLTPFWNAVQDATQNGNILISIPEISKQIDLFNKEKLVRTHKNISALQIKSDIAISFFSRNGETYAQAYTLRLSNYGKEKKVLDCDLIDIEYYASLSLNRPLTLDYVFLGHDVNHKRHFFGFNLQGIVIYDTQSINDYLIPNGNSGVLWTAADNAIPPILKDSVNHE